MCFSIDFRREEDWIEELIVVRCCDEDNGVIFWYVKCSARSNFPEEYVDDHPQEEEETIVGEHCRLHEDLWAQELCKEPQVVGSKLEPEVVV